MADEEKPVASSNWTFYLLIGGALLLIIIVGGLFYWLWRKSGQKDKEIEELKEEVRELRIRRMGDSRDQPLRGQPRRRKEEKKPKENIEDIASEIVDELSE